MSPSLALGSLFESNCNQQSGISTMGWGRAIPVGRVIASPQADATWRGLLCLSKVVSAIWGMIQYQDPGGCSLSSHTKATAPVSLQESLVYPTHPTLHPSRAQGKWLQMKFYAFSLLKPLHDSSHLSQAQRNPAAFHSRMLSGMFSGSGTVGWGTQLGV